LALPPTTGLPQETPAAPGRAVAAGRIADVRAGVPGATRPSSSVDNAVVTQVIQTQLNLTEASISSKLTSGTLVFANPAALQNFLAKDLRDMVRSDILRGFGMMKG
jgi:hypothetical protein